jgi:flagellum-specific peptidoglycan hydrolase FlgJ
VDRWQQEQRDTAALDIKTDLVSAQGDIGAAFSILGAAMLGAIGSDAGLRMIDNSISTNVNKQINMRDSKLRILADQLGSTQQAMAAGKAQLYKIAADKAEATMRLTKADAFEAQTPEILAGLRQKQQLYEQEQQRISLGKTLEKAPEARAPAPADVQKYGEAAASNAQTKRDLDRAANAVGLRGWDPKTGTFANREEVLKNGIPGVGKVDKLIEDLGELPVLGRVIKAGDNAVTSKEGIEVRAALQALVVAQAKRNNPDGRISDPDIKQARDQLGFGTEEGIIRGIEGFYSQQSTNEAQNVAKFGPGAAAAYEGRIDAQGARPPQQPNGPVDTGRPLEPGRAREMLQQERMRPREGLDRSVQEATGQAGPQASVTPMQDVAGEVQAVAGRELPPEGLKIIVAQAAHETGDGQHAPGNNFFGIKGKGNNLLTTEGEGANARTLRADFRAYGSPTESVQDLVALLQRKYPDAWRALERGDAPAYVAALKDGGYFTGSETEYLNGIQRRL